MPRPPRWIIRRSQPARAVQLVYINPGGLEYDCGQAPGHIDDDEVTHWILQAGKPDPGDEIVLSDGSVLQCVAPGRLAVREVRLGPGAVLVVDGFAGRA